MKARTIVRTFAGLLVVVALLAGAGALLIRTAAFHDWARQLIARQATARLNGTVSIGGLRGGLFTGAELTDVRVNLGGQEIIAVDSVSARYGPWQFLSNDIELDALVLVRPRLVLGRDHSGWTIARLAKRSESPSESSRTFGIRSIRVEDGTIALDAAAQGLRVPKRLFGLNAELAFHTGGNRTAVDLQRLAFHATQPDLRVQSLSGRLATAHGRVELTTVHMETERSVLELDGSYQTQPRQERIDLAVTAVPFDVEEISALVPALGGRRLSAYASFTVKGPLDALEIKGDIRDNRAGSVHTDLVADLHETRARGVVDVERLDLTPVLLNPSLFGRLSARSHIDLRGNTSESEGLHGRVILQSARSDVAGYQYDTLEAIVDVNGRRVDIDATAHAYGTSATARGRLSFAGRVGYDLDGRVAGLDIRHLPQHLDVPPLESVVTGAYTVRGAGSDVDAAVQFDASQIEGTTISAGSRARFGMAHGAKTYGFDGHVSDLDVARLGHALDIEAITSPQFGTSLNGHLAVDGMGTSISTLELNATGELERSSALDATLDPLSFDVHVTDGRLTTHTRGGFSALNLATLTTQSQLDGSIAGTFDVNATVRRLGESIGPDDVSADGWIRLSSSSIGPLTLDETSLEARYADSTATVASLTAKGPTINATASGTLVLGTQGSSNMTYHVELDTLEDLGPLIGRELSGGTLLDGTLAGNRERLSTRGQASLRALRVDTLVDALQTDVTFDAAIDDLQPESIMAGATLESTLPVIGGRSLGSLTAMLNYAKPTLEFDATVRENGRTATSAGRFSVFPDYREVRIDRLSVAGGETRWSTPSGQAVVATYSPSGLLHFDALTLLNGAQRITAGGAVAMSGSDNGELTVRMEQVDLAGLGQLGLLERKLKGTLDASAHISGDPEHRRATGRLDVRSGAVDGFSFDALTTTVDYADARARIEALLVQAPGVELTLSGTIPYPPQGDEGADGPLDLTIASTSIDLAVLEAATTALEDASGPLALDVRVGGTLAAPRVEGTIDLQRGAFTLAATGVAYKNVGAHLVLKGEQLEVEQLTLQDRGGHSLQGSGRLDIEGERVRGFDFTMSTHDLSVLDNEFGRMSIDSSVNVYGTLTAPQVAGLVRVRSGRLEVDRLVDRLTSSAYATAPVSALRERQDGEANTGIALNLTVQAPDNLVLRGSDIRPAESSVALGDINLTVGGDFTVRKEAAGEAVLTGSIQTVRGTYNYQGRRFEVLRDGTIAFRGERPIDPALDLDAEREISGIVAHVSINGSLRQPTLALSSQPPVDEADVLSLIVFNQPANKLGEGERASLGERATELASGLVVSPIAESLGRALNLDLFQVETTADAGGGPSVTLGQQVGERLFVRFQQTFGTQDATEFELEFRLADFLRLQGSIGDGQSRANRSFTRRVERGGIDLVVFFSY